MRAAAGGHAGLESVSRSAFAGGPGCQDAGEFLFDSPMVTMVPEARDYAATSFPAGRTILEGVLDLNGRIRREFAFKGGVTTVNTPVRQVLAQRAGVCQDFSHLMIAGLRGLGLPARYNQRLHPHQAAAGPETAARCRPIPCLGRLLAWPGARLGRRGPPRTASSSPRSNVVLGWGRDYGDVSPIFGVILGGGKHSVSVGVDLEPAEEQEAAQHRTEARLQP